MDTCAAIAVVIQVFGFGLVWAFVAGAAPGGAGGAYGGGGGGAHVDYPGASGGGVGAVRIIWGTGRSYPSTNTGDV